MAIDLSVCFSRRVIDCEELKNGLSQIPDLRTTLYVVIGNPCSESADMQFFSFWGDESVSLKQICVRLSFQNAFCCIWKVEHSGMAGYSIYVDGTESESALKTSGDYSIMPTSGIERFSGRQLPIADSQRHAFPELLLDGTVKCYSLNTRTRELQEQPRVVVQDLLEGNLLVDPLLPLEA